MVYSLTMNRKKQDKTTKKTPYTSVTPTIGKGAVGKSKSSNEGKSKKYRPSASMVKQELAAQNRGTGKKIGPKAREQRMSAKRVGKTIKRQETAMQKRGGTKPAKKK